MRPKTYSYLTNNGDENKKKNKRHPKKFVIKRKPKFENYKHCFEATQLKNRKNQLEKYKRNIDSLWENCKEFIRNNRLILKSQQRFRSKKHNVFAEGASKITNEC